MVGCGKEKRNAKNPNITHTNIVRTTSSFLMKRRAPSPRRRHTMVCGCVGMQASQTDSCLSWRFTAKCSPKAARSVASSENLPVTHALHVKLCSVASLPSMLLLLYDLVPATARTLCLRNFALSMFFFFVRVEKQNRHGCAS